MCRTLPLGDVQDESEANSMENGGRENERREDSDVIVANRWSDKLADVAGKVCTRDLFKRD